MRLLFWQLAVICVVVPWTDCALAQRRPIADDTLGNERSIVTPEDNIRGLPGDRIQGGARRGDNLFHSFREFGIGPGRAVYFDDPGVRNILSRVTGGNASEILGRLGVLGDANLFLLNPNGIIFGSGASLDVGGSFVSTTADAIQFGEQGFFSASDPNAPPLLTVQPSAFLFNRIQAEAIETQSIAASGGDGLGNKVRGLRVPNDQNLVLLGGNVIDRSNLNAFGGRVELGGVAGTGTVGLNANGSLSFPDGIARADVLITGGSRINAISNDGGNITINARNIDILGGSSLRAGSFSGSGTGDSQAGNIVLNGTGEIQVGQSSLIINNVGTEGIGSSGNINIRAGSLFVTDGAQLQALTRGQGNVGNVVINATDRVVFDGGTALSSVRESGRGNAGNIRITTSSLVVRNGAQLLADTRGQGNAGNVIIDANDRVVFDDGTAFSSVEAGGIGRGGNISIDTGSLEVRNGARLVASTAGLGNAGNVIINANDRVVFDGMSANGFVSAAFSTVELGAIRGNGGNIRISTNSLSVKDGAYVSATALEQGGRAGNIEITAQSIELDRGNLAAEGGGNIALRDLNLLLLRNGSLISTTDITIDANFIVFSPNENNEIRAESFGRVGGNIDITTQFLFLNNNFIQGLTELPTEVVDVSEQIAQTCPTDGDVVGEFVVTGRGGAPANPAELLGGETVLSELAEVEGEGEGEDEDDGKDRGDRVVRGEIDRPSTATNNQVEIVEAQGWVVSADGKVVLTAEHPAVEPLGSLPDAPAPCPNS